MNSNRRRLAASLVAVGLFGAACTSSAEADSSSREVDIVTIFDDPAGDPGSAPTAPASGGDGFTDGQSLDVPTVDPSRTSTTTSAPEQSTSTTAPTSTTTASTSVPSSSTSGPPPTQPGEWIIGLLNESESAPGRGHSFGVGFDAAVAWANGIGLSDDDRRIVVQRCAPTDGPSAASCANQLVGDGVDAIVHGHDQNSGQSIPILEASTTPVLGGLAASAVDARADGAALSVGGLPAELAGIAAAVVARGFGATAIVHDDTADASALVDELVVPVLDAAGVTHVKVPVPLGTADATAALGPAAASETDSWIVVTSNALCQPVILARSSYALTSTPFYWSQCSTEQIVGTVGAHMEQSFFTTELVTSIWLDVVANDYADRRSLASALIADIDPALADDEDAIVGYVVGLAAIDNLRRGGADLAHARQLPVPHPFAAGELDCVQSLTYPALCSADILLAQYFGGSLVGPPQVVNGIRGR